MYFSIRFKIFRIFIFIFFYIQGSMLEQNSILGSGCEKDPANGKLQI